MSALNSQLIPNIASIQLGSLLSGSTTVCPGVYFAKKSRIKRVDFVDVTGIVSNTSNKLAITLEDSAAVVYASINTFGNAAGALAALQLSKKAALVTADDGSGELEVPAGTLLVGKVVSSGTAVTTLAVLNVEWYPK